MRNSTLSSIRAFALITIFLSTVSFAGSTTTLTVSPAVKGASNVEVPMNFVIQRSGNLDYAVRLDFHTENVSAAAGLDYLSSAGTVTIPANTDSATIPVAITAFPVEGPDRTFRLVIDSAKPSSPLPVSFAAQQTAATGAGPHSAFETDLNGDGKPDLIVANSGQNSLSVFINSSTPGSSPSFAAQQTFATAAGPSAVVAVDLNGDGKPDLISANELSANISVFLNTTSPGSTAVTFAVPQTFAVGAGPVSVTSADLNGDGKRDVIVANSLGGSLSVLLNAMAPGAVAPNFQSQLTFATGTMPVAVEAADINNDGRPDLISANKTGNSVSVLINATSSALAFQMGTQQSFVAGGGPISIAAADINGDGKIDIAVANSTGNSISILLGRTVSSPADFETQQIFAVAQPLAITIADVNGDGKSDVAVATGAATMALLLNDTAAGSLAMSFSGPQNSAIGAGSDSIAIADLNGDGTPDAVIANGADNTLSILSNTTALGEIVNFSDQHLFAAGAQPFSVASADFNGDGKIDMATANAGSDNVSVLRNTTAPGSAVPTFAPQRTFAIGDVPGGVVAVDVNGDGRVDVVAVNQAAGTVSVLTNTTPTSSNDITFASATTFPTGGLQLFFSAADINGDGRPDLMVGDGIADRVWLLFNTTPGGSNTVSFAPAQAIFFGAGNGGGVIAADINGDGKLDLIAVDNGSSNSIAILLNQTPPGASTGVFSLPQSFAAVPGPIAAAAADINADGRTDVIVSGVGLWVLLNTTAPGSSTVSFAAPLALSTPEFVFGIAVADIDHDGRPDLIATNYAVPVVSVFHNATLPGAATASFSPMQTYSTGYGSSSVSLADLNGDGHADLIVSDSDDSFVSVLLNTSNLCRVVGSPAVGTIVHDYIFANRFD